MADDDSRAMVLALLAQELRQAVERAIQESGQVQVINRALAQLDVRAECETTVTLTYMPGPEAAVRADREFLKELRVVPDWVPDDDER